MKEFLPYLEKIGISSKALLGRIEFIYNISCEMCPEKIEDMFITDYIKEDGTREYENLWFFSDGFCSEAKLFISKYDLDITLIKKRVVYYRMTMQDYDFKEATPKSRLVLHIDFILPIAGDLKASGENCDFLKGVLNKYIRPNLIS